jgi:hypothetical protein
MSGVVIRRGGTTTVNLRKGLTSPVQVKPSVQVVRIIQSETMRAADRPTERFLQSSAAAEWVINHNRGYRPIIQVFDPGGNEVEAQLLHFSDNQARVYFTEPKSGSVIVR